MKKVNGEIVNNIDDLTDEETQEVSDFICYLKSKRPKPEPVKDTKDNLSDNLVIEELLKKLETLSAKLAEIKKLEDDVKFWQSKYFELEVHFKNSEKETIVLKNDNQKLKELVGIKGLFKGVFV